jgi:hypothetical protein
MIRRLFTRQEGAPPAASAAGTAARRTRRRRPAVEPLEGRALLSFLTSEHRVSTNPQTTDNTDSDNASSANGASVAVWVNAVSDHNHDIWAQRFDPAEHPAGAPIQVDTLAARDSVGPHVAMDAQGRFVITWKDNHPDGTASVMMRYYSAAGAPLTAITQVTPAGSEDFSPDVAASNGSFVITWAHNTSSTNDDINAERFVISGGVPHGQGIFKVTGHAEFASVAMAPNGRFDIAYARLSSSTGWDIFASQYGSAGNRLRSNISINLDFYDELYPSVAMDNAGNAVVAYQRYAGPFGAIYANRLSSGGAVGNLVFAQSVDAGTNPSVALAPTGGQYVVAYDTDFGVEVTEVDSDDAPLGTLGPVNGFGPAISLDGFGRYTVTYERVNATTGYFDIFSRRDLLN